MKGATPIVEPVSLAVGAQVREVDLSQDLPPDTWDAIRDAFHRHSVLIFRDQELTVEDLARFVRAFGEPVIHEHLLPLTVEGHPECMILHNNAEKPPGLNYWHTDNSGWPNPPLGTVLYCKITPELGGDTLFSNMYMVYEALSRPMQEMLSGLNAVHDIKKAFGADYGSLQRGLRTRGIEPSKHFEQYPAVEHPLVRTHPETKRKALYVSGPYVTHISGLTPAESRAILDFLYRHIETNELVYRHKWQRRDLVLWDNRCTQHLAVADYFPRERLMYRMNITSGSAG